MKKGRNSLEEKIDNAKQQSGYWNSRASATKIYKGEQFYTTTNLDFYIYRRNRILNILNGIDIRGKRILDLGCGDGYYCEYFKRREPKIVGVDISEGMLELAQKRNKSIPLCRIDGSNLPFGNGVFDIVFTIAVLQHCLDEKNLHNLVREMTRLVSGGGRVMIFEAIGPIKERRSERHIRRKYKQYISLFEEYALKSVSYKCLGSPLYYCALLPIHLIAIRYPSITQAKGVKRYLKLVVQITRFADKIWGNQIGLGVFVFVKKHLKA